MKYDSGQCLSWLTGRDEPVINSGSDIAWQSSSILTEGTSLH